MANRYFIFFAVVLSGCNGIAPTAPTRFPPPVVFVQEPPPPAPVNAPPLVAHLIVGPEDPQVGDDATFSILFPRALPSDPVTVDWDFGNGERRQTASTRTRYRYIQAGPYQVSATVTDGEARTAQSSQAILVHAPPAPPKPPPPQPPQFAVSVTCSDNNHIASCLVSAGYDNQDVSAQLSRVDWIWGDSLVEAPPTTNPGQPYRSHTYPLNGTYTVQVIAYWMGRTASATTTVTIP